MKGITENELNTSQSLLDDCVLLPCGNEIKEIAITIKAREKNIVARFTNSCSTSTNHPLNAFISILTLLFTFSVVARINLSTPCLCFIRSIAS